MAFLGPLRHRLSPAPGPLPRLGHLSFYFFTEADLPPLPPQLVGNCPQPTCPPTSAHHPQTCHDPQGPGNMDYKINLRAHPSQGLQGYEPQNTGRDGLTPAGTGPHPRAAHSEVGAPGTCISAGPRGLRSGGLGTPVCALHTPVCWGLPMTGAGLQGRPLSLETMWEPCR